MNADVVLGKPGVLLDHNIYSYCRNSPISRSDPSGQASTVAEAMEAAIKELIAAVLDRKVETNKRYKNKPNKKGVMQYKCNVLVQDIMDALKVPFPKVGVKDMAFGALDGFSSKKGDGNYKGKWVQITGKTGEEVWEEYASKGIPTVVIWEKPDMSTGHIQAMYPGESYETSFAQAGGKQYSAGPHMNHAERYGEGVYEYYIYDYANK